jgi:hypothetical protein
LGKQAYLKLIPHAYHDKHLCISLHKLFLLQSKQAPISPLNKTSFESAPNDR